MKLNLKYLNIFRNKYNVTLMDSKWSPIKKNVNLKRIPTVEEYVYFNEKYYKVLSVIHVINKRGGVYIVIDEFNEIEMKIIKKK